MRRIACVFCIALVASASFARAQSVENSRRQEQLPRDKRGQPEVGPVIPATSLLGREIQSEDGKSIGTVGDVALDLDEGRLAALMVSSGEDSPGAAGLPIPWDLVESVSADKPVQLKLSRQALADAPRLKSVQSLEQTSRVWLATIYQHYKLKPYWQARQQASTWGKASDYGKLFNPDKLVIVDGPITDISYVPPLEGMAVGVQLTIKTTDGVAKAQLGPLSHLSQQKMTFEKDGMVKVKGSQITLAGHPVIMATEIETADDRLVLRDADGAVRWREWSEQDAGYALVSLKKLINKPIRNNQREELGKVSDFAVATEQGLLAYVAMTCTCFGDAAEKYYPVPLSAFVVQPEADAWLLELPLEVLENTPAFRARSWPEKIDRGWVEYVHVRYGRSPFGGVRTQPHAESRQ